MYTDPKGRTIRRELPTHSETVLDPRRFIATRAELRARGMSDRDVSHAVGAGRLHRVRRGWYAIPATPPELVAAVAAGGRIGCVSALDWHGVWTMPHAPHIRVAHPSAARGVVVHWAGASRGLVDSVVDALDQYSRCGREREVVVAADSALNKQLITMADVAAIFGRTRRGRRMLDRLDPRAESGTETLLRLRLHGRGIHLTTQVEIAGVGRVDFVVGDRLVIEVDGRTWHDTESGFEKDRRRDAALVASGYLVMRFSYYRVMNELDDVVGEILAVIRRRDHRGPRSR